MSTTATVVTPEGREVLIKADPHAELSPAKVRKIGDWIAALERDGVFYETEVVRWARWEYCAYRLFEPAAATEPRG